MASKHKIRWEEKDNSESKSKKRKLNLNNNKKNTKNTKSEQWHDHKLFIDPQDKAQFISICEAIENSKINYDYKPAKILISEIAQYATGKMVSCCTNDYNGNHCTGAIPFTWHDIYHLNPSYCDTCATQAYCQVCAIHENEWVSTLNALNPICNICFHTICQSSAITCEGCDKIVCTNCMFTEYWCLTCANSIKWDD